MASFKAKSRRGFTLIEVLVTVAIVAVVALIAAPSMKNFIQMQRLKSVSSELMTNLQYARSEAVSRGQVVGLRFGSNTSLTCYVIATKVTGGCVPASVDACDCRRGPGSACDGSAPISARWTELKTVSMPTALGVAASPSDPFSKPISFDPKSGGLLYTNCNYVGLSPGAYGVDAARVDSTGALVAGTGPLRTSISPTGRPSVCSCGGKVAGYPACSTSILPVCP